MGGTCTGCCVLLVFSVNLTGLEPGERYVYQVGGPGDSWSEVLWFRALLAGSDWAPRLAVYGDMGAEVNT